MDRGVPWGNGEPGLRTERGVPWGLPRSCAGPLLAARPWDFLSTALDSLAPVLGLRLALHMLFHRPASRLETGVFPRGEGRQSGVTPCDLSPTRSAKSPSPRPCPLS